jgi:putative endonuclease
MTYERKKLGFRGENLALNFLERKGFVLLGRNVRLKFGEIDLLMKDKDTIVVVEVKTKKSDLFGLPQEEVDWHKRRKLVRLAQAVAQKFPESKIRIDVAAVDDHSEKLDYIYSAVEDS